MILDQLQHHSPAVLAGTASFALGIAGATDQIPGEVPHYMWLVATFLGPAVTAMFWRAVRIAAASIAASKRARALEERRRADEDEAKAKALTGDDQQKLLSEAADLRVEAAVDEAQAAAIEKEAAATH
jgi:hypothetical protein